MANLDTRSKRASSVNLLKPYQLALVLPDATIAQGDRQHTAWSYSGILAGVVIPPGGSNDSAIGVPRWPLSLHMYETIGGALVYTFPDPQGVVITDNEHGFESLSGFQEMRAHEAFWLYDLAPAKWVVLACGGFSVWEGRLEDRKVERGGFGFTAFGAKRAMDDVPYIGLWSTNSYAGIRPVTDDEIAACSPHLWGMDNNNRIYFEINPNNTYANDADMGAQIYQSPHYGEETIKRFSFSYDIDIPTDWVVRARLMSNNFGSITIEWTFTSIGVPATGTQDITAVGPERVLEIDIRNNTGAPVTGAAGYAKLTDIRILGQTTATIFADQIAKGMVDFIQSNFGFAFNPNQLSASYALIQSPGVDLQEEIFEDLRPSEILNYLVEKGDASDRKWEWGVWENQILFFRPRGDAALHWYVDADELTLDSTLESLVNQVYTLYQDPNGRTLRTSYQDNPESHNCYGIWRRAAVSERTTSQVEADLTRDAYLNNHKEIAPRASLTLFGLFDAAGARYPLWMARAGDTVTIRNLPPTLSTEIDRIRTFRISRKSYNVDTDTLTPVPEYALPTLEIQIASALAVSNASPLGLPNPNARRLFTEAQPSFS